MQAGGNIFLNASLQLPNNLTLDAGGNIEISAPISTSSQLTMIAGKNITSSNPVTIQGSTINLVVDNLFPTPPNIGLGEFNFPNISILATTSLRLYAGAFGISQFPATINGTAYRPGQLNMESYGVWYPSTGSYPYHVYYKTSTISQEIRDYFLAVSEPFQDWSEWWSSLFLTDCKYLHIPFRDLSIVPYSLITPCPCCCQIIDVVKQTEKNE